MGIVQLDDGQFETDDLEGIYNLPQLIADIRSSNYTTKYRILVLKALGKCGKIAWSALTYIQDIAKDANASLAEAALLAIKEIDPSNPCLKDSPKSVVNEKTKKEPEVTKPIEKTKKKPSAIQKVIFDELKVNSLTDGTKSWGHCNFCGKNTMFHDDLKKFCDRLVGPNKLYCHFCIRNDLYQRYSRNVLVLTFRGIIGYYYYCFHANKTPAMLIGELQDYVELHTKLGVQNPLFRYDPESFLWFVDFSKIGTGRRKMPVESVLKTVIQILAGLNLYNNIRDASPFKIYDRYREAIMDFYNHRKRPDNQKILAPTPLATGIPIESSFNSDKAIPVDLLRNFTPANMVENNYWYKSRNKFY